MPEFDEILFDFDGVLLDSEPVHCDCWREALAPLGVPITWEVYAAHCVGAADREMIHVFAKLLDPPADPAKREMVKGKDQVIVAKVPDRGQKFKAPEILQPTGQRGRHDQGV